MDAVRTEGLPGNFNAIIEPVLLTIGHSNHSWEVFLGLLRAHQVNQLADVRRYPASRRHPQFGGPTLARSLEAAGIGYAHHEALGGRRPPRPDSPNAAWRDAAFRGYADYMQTPAFEQALIHLLEQAAAGSTAILCAEADPRHCHRSLIADALLARGVPVEHILTPGQREPHALTPAAQVERGRLWYPAGQLRLGANG